jgi:LacI family transcriptional regulator
LLIAPVYRLETAAPVYEEIRRAGVPTVILGPSAPFCAGFVQVETDDLAGSYALTQHLIQLGHQRIAFLAGPPAVPAYQHRLEGYRRALREAQIEWDDRLVFHAGSTIEEGEKAALQLIDEAPGATAIQAVNDLVAIGAATVFLNQGIQIPAQMSVTGFGNILSSEHFRVPLTTVRQAKFELGSTAMEMLLRMVAGERVEPRRISGGLVLRQSTSPPAK